MKVLRTNNSLEFCSNESDRFCAAKKMTKHKTFPYNTQQNGLVEKMNKSLLERVGSMMIDARLFKDLWGEALKIVAHLINRSPSSTIDFLTSMQKWSGHQLDFKNLKAFRCAAYAHIKDDNLRPRALKYVFIGYSKGVKGFNYGALKIGKTR